MLEDPAERASALNATVLSLVRGINGRLFSFHAHDVRERDWRDHRCPGSGVMNFPALFALLRDIGYVGLIEIELEEPEMEAAVAAAGTYLSEFCQRSAGTTDAEQPSVGDA